MRKFIIRIFLFSAAYLIYAIIAWIIDPYSILHKEEKQRLFELKSQISYPLNQQLFLLQMYSEQPTDVILLGDSRTQSLKSSVFEEFTQKKATNLAYGAAAISDIIDTFWYAAGIHDLNEVYIGINFNLFNEHNYSPRVKEALRLMNSPEAYLFSKYCYKSLYLIIKAGITGKNVEMGKPAVSKEEFWKFQLDSTASVFYRFYKYPDSYQKGLTEISQYCRDNDIKLVFFIPPTHIDLQQRVIDFDLTDEEKAFKTFISSLGNMHDFDTPCDMNRSYDNFQDPFHFNDSIATLVIKEIASVRQE
jgi:predicted membrane protein